MPVDIAVVRAQLEGLAREYESTSPLLREHLLAEAKRGEKYAKDLADATFHNTRTHTTKGGYTDEPGDYRNSIEGMVVFHHGRWHGRVIARDWKAAWIEYGTKKWPKKAILRRTAAYLRGGAS